MVSKNTSFFLVGDALRSIQININHYKVLSYSLSSKHSIKMCFTCLGVVKSEVNSSWFGVNIAHSVYEAVLDESKL